MTARDEALALLRERFKGPWRVAVHSAEHRWSARAQLGQVFVDGFGESPQESARACIASWDEATKGCAPFQRAIGDVCRDAYQRERALADRLGEALERAVDAADVCKRKHDEWQCDTGAHCVDASDCTGPALAAWRAARGKA